MATGIVLPGEIRYVESIGMRVAKFLRSIGYTVADGDGEEMGPLNSSIGSIGILLDEHVHPLSTIGKVFRPKPRRALLGVLYLNGDSRTWKFNFYGTDRKTSAMALAQLLAIQFGYNIDVNCATEDNRWETFPSDDRGC